MTDSGAQRPEPPAPEPLRPPEPWPLESQQPPESQPLAEAYLPAEGHLSAEPAPSARETASAPSRSVDGRPAFPGAAPTAPSFDDEISVAVSYEKGLAVKALLAIALVLAVLALREFLLT